MREVLGAEVMARVPVLLASVVVGANVAVVLFALVAGLR